MFSVVGLDQSWIMCSPQTNFTRVCLEGCGPEQPDRDVAEEVVSVRLLWSVPECD